MKSRLLRIIAALGGAVLVLGVHLLTSPVSVPMPAGSCAEAATVNAVSDAGQPAAETCPRKRSVVPALGAAILFLGYAIYIWIGTQSDATVRVTPAEQIGLGAVTGAVIGFLLAGIGLWVIVGAAAGAFLGVFADRWSRLVEGL
jgi:hypothetical protein